MAGIELKQCTKSYPGGVQAVSDVSLQVADGEFMVLVGPSGSGKSTLLRMIAGLEDMDSGEVVIDGQRVDHLPPKARDIAMIFQDYALYPQMTVADNMAFPLRMQRRPVAERTTKVTGTAELLGLIPFLPRRPGALSGGQRQRVAMGRAIVREPRAFLMDEPLSNLDAKLRVEMRAEISRLHQRLRTTTILVTHDQTEAMTMGSRIVVMRNGRVEQVGTPHDVYEHPANLFVGEFIGSPQMNVVNALLEPSDFGAQAKFGRFTLPVPGDRLPPSFDGVAALPVLLGIRPEAIEEEASAHWARHDGVLEAEVSLVQPMGAEVFVEFLLDVPSEIPGAPADPGLEPILTHRGRAAFVARVDRRSRVQTGTIARFAVDVEQLYFFDPQTEVSLMDPLPSADA